MKKIESYLLVLLFVTLPFEHALTFNFAGFTVKPPYFSAILLVAYLIYKIVSTKKISLAAYDYVLLAFLANSFLSIFWSINKSQTFIISSMYLFCALIYFAVKNCLDENSFKKAKKWFLYLGVATSLFAFWQFFADGLGVSQKYTLLSNLYVSSVFGFPRVQSTFFEPGFFANFLLIPIFLNIEKLEKLTWKNSASFVIIFTAFLLTLSRGAFVALALSFLVFALLLIIRKRDKLKIIYLSMVLMFISAGLALGSVAIISGLKGVQSYSNQAENSKDLTQGSLEESAQNFTRNATIKIAIKNWRRNVFGVGTGAFGALPEFKKTRELGNSRQTVNSLYPEVLAEQGIQGLIIFLIFLGLMMFSLCRRFLAYRDLSSLILGSAVLAIFIQYASFSTLYLIYIWVFLGLAMFHVESSSSGR